MPSDPVRATLMFGIETTSKQKATALRDKCAEWLNADPDVTVHTQNFTADPIRGERLEDGGRAGKGQDKA